MLARMRQSPKEIRIYPRGFHRGNPINWRSRAERSLRIAGRKRR
jgi:hypothetical protein